MATNMTNPETPDAVNASNPHKLPLRLKTAYGFGSVAFGVKNNGFDYFLLLFYSQVVGLDAHLVGIAITTALVFDALSDPVVGYWSDNLRSRWGRRHPFMYAALFPFLCPTFCCGTRLPTGTSRVCFGICWFWQ